MALGNTWASYWKNIASFESLICKGQVKEYIQIQKFISCFLPITAFVQEDALILDSNGGQWPVHADILRLRFPIFRHIEEIRTVMLSETSPVEVELLLGLAYGGDRSIIVKAKSLSIYLTISGSSASIRED